MNMVSDEWQGLTLSGLNFWGHFFPAYKYQRSGHMFIICWFTGQATRK
jgi:hypothetical protein